MHVFMNHKENWDGFYIFRGGLLQNQLGLGSVMWMAQYYSQNAGMWAWIVDICIFLKIHERLG